MSKIWILKVGGSLLSPSEDKIFDFTFAKNLKETLLKYTIEGNQFILCIGGGYLCRKYQKILREEGYDDEDQHNIGVATINVNAEMLNSVFEETVERMILRYQDYDNETPIVFNKPFLITAAGGPGHSSDWNTIKLALRANSTEIISLKNIDGVYSADPTKNPNAKRINKLSWDEYLKVIGNPTEHAPGASYPVDPLASALAKEHNIKFYIVNGSDLANLEDLMAGKEFEGSVING
jgi:uridylate kinase